MGSYISRVILSPSAFNVEMDKAYDRQLSTSIRLIELRQELQNLTGLVRDVNVKLDELKVVHQQTPPVESQVDLDKVKQFLLDTFDIPFLSDEVENKLYSMLLDLIKPHI